MMATLTQDWRVAVYDDDNGEISSWVLQNRTEHEASEEALADVERDYPDADWTLTAIAPEQNA